MKQYYTVCMDDTYVRDAQMYDTADLADEDLITPDLQREDIWYDMEPVPFIKTVLANSTEEAVNMAAKDCHYDSRTLIADMVPVPRLFLVQCTLGKGDIQTKTSGIVMAYTEEDAKAITCEKLASLAPKLETQVPWIRMSIQDITVNQPLDDTIAGFHIEFVLSEGNTKGAF